MKPTIAILYSDAAAAALIDALKRWRLAYAPSSAYEELLANYVHHIDVHTNITPGGRARVYVTVEGRRQRDTDSYWYEATMTAGELRLLSLHDKPRP